MEPINCVRELDQAVAIYGYFTVKVDLFFGVNELLR